MVKAGKDFVLEVFSLVYVEFRESHNKCQFCSSDVQGLSEAVFCLLKVPGHNISRYLCAADLLKTAPFKCIGSSVYGRLYRANTKTLRDRSLNAL